MSSSMPPPKELVAVVKSKVLQLETGMNTLMKEHEQEERDPIINADCTRLL